MLPPGSSICCKSNPRFIWERSPVIEYVYVLTQLAVFFPKMVRRLHSIWYTKYIPTYLTAFFSVTQHRRPKPAQVEWQRYFSRLRWHFDSNQPTNDEGLSAQTFFPPVDEPHFRYCWKSIEFIMRERGCNSVICFTYNACRHSWYMYYLFHMRWFHERIVINYNFLTFFNGNCRRVQWNVIEVVVTKNIWFEGRKAVWNLPHANWNLSNLGIAKW